MKLIAGLRTFRLVLVLSLALVWVSFIVFRALGEYPSFGLYVRLNDPPTPPGDRFEQPLIVTVRVAQDAHDPSGRTWYPPTPHECRVNSRLVPWDQLESMIRAELSRRPHRVVYVQGESNVQAGPVLKAIDIVNSAWPGVPVVLGTKASHQIPATSQRQSGH